MERQLYGRPLSTIFGPQGKTDPFALEDDLDPIVGELRVLSYRYVRLYFHQVKDKFILFSGWRDPAWTDTRSIRAGIESDEKSVREVVFGRNIIDIEQKSIPRLLVDEVSKKKLLTPLMRPWPRDIWLICSGVPPLLHFSGS